MAPQESPLGGMKRAVGERGSSTSLEENGCHSPVKKKPKIEIEEKDKEEAERESFVCRSCLQEIGRAYDYFGMIEYARGQPDGIGGFFRYVVNVDQEHSADPGPGYNFFNRRIFCSQCFDMLGSFIVRMTPLDRPNEDFDILAGNYCVIMNSLRIRRGILLLDAVTKEVVGQIHN